MRIRVLLTENQIAEEFQEALKQRNIPEKFFYWFPLSVHAWLNLCTDGAYRNFVRSDSLIRNHSRDIARDLPGGKIHVVSLGSGQATKDVFILKTLREMGCAVTYRPVDSSQTLLEMACAEAEEQNFKCEGVKADIARAEHLREATLQFGQQPCLYLLLGNTFGAFEPLLFARLLREIMRPQDYILLDGEIYAEHQTIAGYDNPLNRAFALGPILGAGLQETAGDLVFEDEMDPRYPGVHRLNKHFRINLETKLCLAGEQIHFSPGEKILMNHSGKFSCEGLLSLLSDHASLVPVRELLSQDQLFLMVLARRRG